MNSETSFPYCPRKQHSSNQTTRRKLTWNDPVGWHFLIHWTEIFNQKIILFTRWPQSRHSITRKETRNNMNESKGSFEWFLHDMVIVRLDLLSPLNIKQVPQTTSQTVHLFTLHHFLILNQLLNQTEITTYCSHLGIQLHVPIHIEDCVRVGSHSHIQKKWKFRLKFLTKTIQKPIMRIKLTCLFIFNAEKKIDIEKPRIYFSIFVQRFMQSPPLSLIVH